MNIQTLKAAIMSFVYGSGQEEFGVDVIITNTINGRQELIPTTLNMDNLFRLFMGTEANAEAEAIECMYAYVEYMMDEGNINFGESYTIHVYEQYTTTLVLKTHSLTNH